MQLPQLDILATIAMNIVFSDVKWQKVPVPVCLRYPVTYNDAEDNEHKTRYTITDMDKYRINTMRYKFGSNNLFIGSAIIKVLERLEEKYDLDFNELTKAKK